MGGCVLGYAETGCIDIKSILLVGLAAGDAKTDACPAEARVSGIICTEMLTLSAAVTGAIHWLLRETR